MDAFGERQSFEPMGNVTSPILTTAVSSEISSPEALNSVTSRTPKNRHGLHPKGSGTLTLLGVCFQRQSRG